MRLFISYSRDDKAWTSELWRALRDRAHHDTWSDQRILPAQDWWDTILTNIEQADAVIYVMSPKSVESIYCVAEMEYALALNKPILPLMLKICDLPAELKRRRIQYEIVDTQALSDVLFVVAQSLGEIRVNLVQDKYPAPKSLPPRPHEPKPARKQVAETFTLAEEAAAENNFTLAEKLFQQVIDADPKGIGLAAQERLNELRFERERDADYQTIVQMVANPALDKGTRSLWKVYVGKYGAEYDPDGIAGQFVVKPKRSKVYDILPSPFEWIEIPTGKVTLITGRKSVKNYIREDQSQIFNVPAFVIAKYPITNAQFAEFVKASGYYEQKWWSEVGWYIRNNKSWTEPLYWQNQNFNDSDQPVVGVSWYESMAFTCWLNEVSSETVTLPTEHQWQRAAQGYDDRKYPWGNKWEGKRCNNSVRPYESHYTTSVQYYQEKGDSPFGVVDMAGNVWEWCLTTYESDNITSDETEYVLRGGSWSNYYADSFSATDCDVYSASMRDNNIGFRIVRLP